MNSKSIGDKVYPPYFGFGGSFHVYLKLF